MRAVLAASLAVTITVALSLAAASGSPADERRPQPRDPRDAAAAAVRVFATGEMRGFFSPCGCEDRQFGGLPRRASYLAQAARPGDVRIDLGNAAAGSGALRDLRVGATLDALDRLGYVAFVPGMLELLSGQELIAAAAGKRVRLVAANLLASDGRAPLASFVLHDLPDDRVAAVVGLVGELPTGVAEFTVTPPRPALERVLAELGGRADVVIVAASMPDDDARQVTAGLAGIALVLAPRIPDAEATMTASFSTDESDDGLAAGAPPMALVGDFAAYVRRVDLAASSAGPPTVARAWRAWLGEEWADDPALAAFVREVQKRAIALDPTLVPDILTALVERGSVGSRVCAECHAAAYRTWAESGHAHAMATLVDRDSARDPGCVPCHLVDLPGAFDPDAASASRGPFTPQAGDGLGVGCEACHGGREEHVRNAMSGVVPPGGAPPWTARSTCKGCHHPPEVKHFAFEAAWPHIEHGAANPPGAAK